jgi:hypothetical protein
MSEHQYINERREDKKDRICEAAALERVVRILLLTIKPAQKNCSDRSFYVGGSRHITEWDKKNLWVVQRAETLRER